MQPVDPLSALLDGPRARGAFLLRSSLAPPWALRISDEAPITLVTMVRGDAWVLPDVGPPRQLSTGDVAVVRGPEHYTMADDPATVPTVVIGPGEVCTSADDGRYLAQEWHLGVRTWGMSLDAPTVLLTGTYPQAGALSQPLLAALPHVIVLRRAEWASPLAPVLAEEIGRDGPGQRAVLDRLLDVLLVAALRAWFDRGADDAPAWYRARSDAVVGAALRLLEGDPAHPWTVGGLAGRVGVSRAALARRFTELVGEPPMAYLTGRRLALAADLLTRPDLTIGAVARRVGYSTPFALSTAFKRERGVSPQEHRRRTA